MAIAFVHQYLREAGTSSELLSPRAGVAQEA
jgi:hypothetical protein